MFSTDEASEVGQMEENDVDNEQDVIKPRIKHCKQLY